MPTDTYLCVRELKVQMQWLHSCYAGRQKSMCKTWYSTPAPKTEFRLSQGSLSHACAAPYRNQREVRVENLKRDSETHLWAATASSNWAPLFQGNLPPAPTLSHHGPCPSPYRLIPSLFPPPDTAWHVFLLHLDNLMVTWCFGNRSSLFCFRMQFNLSLQQQGTA